MKGLLAEQFKFALLCTIKHDRSSTAPSATAARSGNPQSLPGDTADSGGFFIDKETIKAALDCTRVKPTRRRPIHIIEKESHSDLSPAESGHLSHKELLEVQTRLDAETTEKVRLIEASVLASWPSIVRYHR